MKYRRILLLIIALHFISMSCSVVAKFPIEKKLEIKTRDYTRLVSSKIKRIEVTLIAKDTLAIQNFEKIIEKSKTDTLLNKHLSRIIADQIYRRHHSLYELSSVFVGVAAGGFIISLALINPGNEYLAASVAMVPYMIYGIPGIIKSTRALKSTFYLAKQYDFGNNLHIKNIKFYRK